MFARKQSFVGSKCLNFNIKTVTCCIKIPRTLEVLKPYIENIMYETVIPIMMVSQKDQNLFYDDPVEFIRKQDDLTESLFMPKVTVVDLLQHICQIRTQGKKAKVDFLVPFLNYAVNNMTQYLQMQQ